MAATGEEHKDPFKAKVIGLLFALIVRFVFLTSRKRYIDDHHITQFMDSGESIIVAAWHNRLAMSPFNYSARAAKGRHMRPIASSSKDGAIAAWAMGFLGHPCVRGSSSRHGARAMRQMIRILRKGGDLAFTPDGPRGPRHHVAEGVLLAAKLSGAPIVPLSYGAKRHRRLRSWDRMMVPYPFNRLNIIYGQPIYVPRDADEATLAAKANELKEELLRIGEVSARF